jgi:hypothetical protein
MLSGEQAAAVGVVEVTLVQACFLFVCCCNSGLRGRSAPRCCGGGGAGGLGQCCGAERCCACRGCCWGSDPAVPLAPLSPCPCRRRVQVRGWAADAQHAAARRGGAARHVPRLWLLRGHQGGEPSSRGGSPTQSARWLAHPSAPQGPALSSMLTSPQDGTPCRNPVNKASCQYCTYHLASAYKKIRTSRPELNTPGVLRPPPGARPRRLRGACELLALPRRRRPQGRAPVPIGPLPALSPRRHGRASAEAAAAAAAAFAGAAAAAQHRQHHQLAGAGHGATPGLGIARPQARPACCCLLPPACRRLPPACCLLHAACAPKQPAETWSFLCHAGSWRRHSSGSRSSGSRSRPSRWRSPAARQARGRQPAGGSRAACTTTGPLVSAMPWLQRLPGAQLCRGPWRCDSSLPAPLEAPADDSPAPASTRTPHSAPAGGGMIDLDDDEDACPGGGGASAAAAQHGALHGLLLDPLAGLDPRVRDAASALLRRGGGAARRGRCIAWAQLIPGSAPKPAHSCNASQPAAQPTSPLQPPHAGARQAAASAARRRGGARPQPHPPPLTPVQGGSRRRQPAAAAAAAAAGGGRPRAGQQDQPAGRHEQGGIRRPQAAAGRQARRCAERAARPLPPPRRPLLCRLCSPPTAAARPPLPAPLPPLAPQAQQGGGPRASCSRSAPRWAWGPAGPRQQQQGQQQQQQGPASWAGAPAAAAVPAAREAAPQRRAAGAQARQGPLLRRRSDRRLPPCSPAWWTRWRGRAGSPGGLLPGAGPQLQRLVAEELAGARIGAAAAAAAAHTASQHAAAASPASQTTSNLPKNQHHTTPPPLCIGTAGWRTRQRTRRCTR